MKKLRFLAVGLYLSAAAAGAVDAAKQWADAFKAPRAVLLSLDPSCAKDCTVLVTMQADAQDKKGQPLTWQEGLKIAIPPDVLADACVADDGPRPSGIPQTRKKCAP